MQICNKNWQEKACVAWVPGGEGKDANWAECTEANAWHGFHEVRERMQTEPSALRPTTGPS